MDTKTLVVGQTVTLYGSGYWKGTVVSITQNGVGVESDDGFAQFDKDGKETPDSRRRRLGQFSVGFGYPEFEPWELVQGSWTRT